MDKKRRLDDRIDELCEKVRNAHLDDKEFEPMSRDLLWLWREKMHRIRKTAAAHSGDEELRTDRRAGES